MGIRPAGLLGALPLLVVLALGSCMSPPVRTPASDPPPGPDRTATILAINDVYRIEGLEEGAVGGLARVRALRRELERSAPDLLFLHGGDFLFPSFASRMFRGEQMIAVMNALDGAEGVFDPRMFVTFGNHEFERARTRDAAFLKSRIDGSEFRWLGGNITFTNGPDGAPLIASKNLSRTALIETGGLRIGLFGLTLPLLGIEYVADFEGEQAAARALTEELRSRGAEVVVGLTHLNAVTDRRLLESLGDAGPDLIVGGHDHDATAFQVGRRWVLKADSDARTASIIRITRKPDGSLQVAHEMRRLEQDAPEPDPPVQALVDQWEARHAAAFCEQNGAPSGCLNEVYGRTRTRLEAEENKIRGRETSLGDWIADRMIQAFSSCGAQVAFINSGSLRINQDLPAGTTITRRHLEELFAYPTPLHLLRIDGATLAKVADQSVRGWPGAGSWLQIGGFGFRHDTARRTASDLTWLGGKDDRPVRPDESVLAVTGDYLVNPEAGDQDGYQMLSRAQIVGECAIDGLDLKALAIRELKAAEPSGIAPRTEGRICQGASGSPCRLAAR